MRDKLLLILILVACSCSDKSNVIDNVYSSGLYNNITISKQFILVSQNENTDYYDRTRSYISLDNEISCKRILILSDTKLYSGGFKADQANRKTSINGQAFHYKLFDFYKNFQLGQDLQQLKCPIQNTDFFPIILADEEGIKTTCRFTT